MTRARLILNPSSGRERAPDNLERLTSRLAAQFGPVEVAVTDGCGTIFVAGGDGTLNETINGLAKAEALDRVTVGVVPLGTGNDFAAALGIPSEVDAALDVLLAGREIRADLGEVNGRVFVNTSGGGFIAEVSVAVTPQLKTIAGRLAYLLGGAQALMEFEPVPTSIVLEPGSRHLEDRLYAFAVCNSRSIGGGRLIAPDAVIDDGLLDVCLIQGMSTLEFVSLVRKVADGDHVHDPRVIYLQAETVQIECARPVHVNTDGEVFEVSRCDYRVLPKAARFLAGDAPSASATPAASSA